jgi:hypothetical protein
MGIAERYNKAVLRHEDRDRHRVCVHCSEVMCADATRVERRCHLEGRLVTLLKDKFPSSMKLDVQTVCVRDSAPHSIGRSQVKKIFPSIVTL